VSMKKSRTIINSHWKKTKYHVCVVHIVAAGRSISFRIIVVYIFIIQTFFCGKNTQSFKKMQQPLCVDTHFSSFQKSIFFHFFLMVMYITKIVNYFKHVLLIVPSCFENE